MSQPSAVRSGLTLAGFIAASFAAGALGAWATFSSVQSWYPLLHKPSWNPPSAVFGPVWTVLYVLMGLAIWRAWRAGLSGGARSASGLVTGYFVQLICNALWSVLFFGLRQPAWALVDIGVLWSLLLWLQLVLGRVDRLAAVLWLPYMLWVSLAAVLNAAIVRLN